MKSKTFNRIIQMQAVFSSLAFLLSYSSPVHARTSDADKAMNIVANKVVLNEKEGVSRYLGKVKISQGSRVISGDSIAIYQEDKKITRIVIKGKPALFSQLNDHDEETRASSMEMIYHADKDLLILEQDAMLKQKDNVFHSDRISYNTAKDIITAGQDSGSTDQRVKITIHPEKDSNSK